MLVFNGRRQHHDLARTARRKRKTQRRRTDVRDSFQLGAKSSDLDAQPRAMRFVGMLCPKGAGQQRTPGHIRGPRFGQRAR